MEFNETNNIKIKSIDNSENFYKNTCENNKKRTLFVDRDGTLIQEPKETQQINSLAEMQLTPGVISALKSFSLLGYEIVVVTNQDGLGGAKNSLENFDLINTKISQILASEDIAIKQFFTCPHYESDNCLCRKPKIGLVSDYIKNENIDVSKSLMVGDRISDLSFAENIGVKGFLIGAQSGKYFGWKDIVAENLNTKSIKDKIKYTANDSKKSINKKQRIAECKRKTSETSILCYLNLDGQANYQISTGLKFLDHMLEQFAKHSAFDLELKCEGDLQIDEHHTIEDVAIVLGDAFKKALGDKKGIERYAFERVLVMDEARTSISIDTNAMVSVDISSRPYLVFEAVWNREFVGDLPTEMISHFFYSFCLAAGITAHFIIEGNNTHHKIESCFKAFAKVLRDASRLTSLQKVSSTKGVL